MVYRVSPTEPLPTHDILLTKGADKVGLILSGAAGLASDLSIDRSGYPTSAIKLYQGDETYSSAEPPFKPISQEDWSGGRGGKTFEDDRRRYADGWRTTTWQDKKAFLGPQEQYSTGWRTVEQNTPGSVLWMPMYGVLGAPFYWACPFTGSAAYTATRFEFWLKRVGTPGNLTIGFWSVAAGNPNALLSSVVLTPGGFGSDTLSQLRLIVVNQVIAAGTNYFVSLQCVGTDNSVNHWEIGQELDVANPARTSTDGIAWAASFDVFYFRISGTDPAHDVLEFTYKNAKYMVKRFDSGAASYLWMNGDRGNTTAFGAANTLTDGIKAWPVNIFAGDIALIIRGPGSEEVQPWRNIVSNTGTVLTVDANWLVAHTTATDYVIISRHYWRQIMSLGGHVTDVAVCDNYVYFARGETSSLNILAYQEVNLGAVLGWTVRTQAEGYMASYLTAIRAQDGFIMYTAQQSIGSSLYGASIARYNVPPKWGLLYRDMGELAPTDQPWSSRQIPLVTPSLYQGFSRVAIAAAFTTGVVAVQDIPAGIDILAGDRVGLLVRSDTAITGAAHLSLKLSSEINLGDYQQALSLVHFDATGNTYEPIELGARDPNDAITQALDLDAGDMFGIKSDRPFDYVKFKFTAALNGQNQTMVGYYFNGRELVTVTLVDNTLAGGTDTWGQDGTITLVPQADWEAHALEDAQAGAAIDYDTSAGYWLFLKPTGNLDSVTFESVTVGRSSLASANIGLLTADLWTWLELSITPTEWPWPDAASIKSVGIDLSTDYAGIVNLDIAACRIVSSAPRYIKMAETAKITGMAQFKISERTDPIVFLSSGEIFRLDTALGDIPIQFAPAEAVALASDNNGKAWTIKSKELWFNLADRVERWILEQMDDLGPDTGEGMPANRRGQPVAMVSYPGQVLLAIDGGAVNYSSVMLYDGAWHELYRAPRAGERIRGMGLQSVPTGVDRLWVAQGTDIIWLPLSLSPLNEPTYQFTHEGNFITARVTGGMQDILKYWHSLKVASELMTSYSNICIDYRVNSAPTWTAITAGFQTSPFQEELLGAHNVVGRWLELRVRLLTRDCTKTPVLLGTILETLVTWPVRWSYTLTFRLVDNDHDLQGQPDDIKSYKAKIDLLDLWVLDALPIYMNSLSTLENGIWVKPQPVPVKRLNQYYDPHLGRMNGYICQMTLLGLG